MRAARDRTSALGARSAPEREAARRPARRPTERAARRSSARSRVAAAESNRPLRIAPRGTRRECRTGGSSIPGLPTSTDPRVRLEFPILSLNPGLRQRCVAPDVWGRRVAGGGHPDGRGACACRAREATSSSSALSRSCSWMMGSQSKDGAAADRIGFGASGYAGVSLAVAAPSATGPAGRGPGIAAAHAPAPTRDSLNLTIHSGGFTRPLCGLFFLRRSHQDQPPSVVVYSLCLK